MVSHVDGNHQNAYSSRLVSGSSTSFRIVPPAVRNFMPIFSPSSIRNACSLGEDELVAWAEWNCGKGRGVISKRGNVSLRTAAMWKEAKLSTAKISGVPQEYIQ
jgi:hypothetical protein